MASLRRVDSVNNGIGGLRLLGADNSLSLSLISLPRDKIAASMLCQVYLQNVDPIIKILHRPSLSKWMLDGGQYLGSPDGHNSVRVCGLVQAWWRTAHRVSIAARAGRTATYRGDNRYYECHCSLTVAQ